MDRKRVIILGAAGRDFHNFNTFFRGKPEYDVVAFTATQIPDIAGRKYPAQLAGELYPDGIPIYLEDDLDKLIRQHLIDIVVFAYSNVPHEYVMHRASISIAAGANFWLLGAKDTQIKSTKPLVSICAVRTGSGKSQTARRVVQYFKEQGHRVVAIRHPMPYGDLVKQACQRFATYEDFAKHACTIEEREEYEPYIEQGLVIYAGVDYEMILREAEKEADVIIWDGGNNDISFYKTDLAIVVADPHRAGHELRYHPGETNLRMADVIVINKMDTATAEGIATVKKNIQSINPRALVIEADSPVTVDHPALIRGKKVLVIEDGPTLTHGEMKYGAGIVAARNNGAAEVVDPRPYAVESLKATFHKFPHLSNILPVMGYGAKQVSDLEKSINATPCDAVVIGTPINLGKLIHINKPSTRVTYALKERGSVRLDDVLSKITITRGNHMPTVPAATASASSPVTVQTKKVRHMLHLKDYTGAELREIIELALKIKKNQKDYWTALDHKTLIMLFQKTSTRTRASFETGMTQLGGHAMFLDWRTTQLDKAGLGDEAKCLERYGELIAGRLMKHKDLVSMAEAVRVPVINMCCEKYHPCQGLGDMLTMYEHAGHLNGLHLVYTGIANNVSNSLVTAGTKLGVKITLAVPEKDPDAMDLELEAAARKTGNYDETLDFESALKTADFVYTDTWINMEYFSDPKFAEEKERRIKAFKPYQISADVLRRTGSHAKVMHCLPAHLGYEITRDAVDHVNSVIFDQAENRLHIQKAIMIWILQKSGQLS